MNDKRSKQGMGGTFQVTKMNFSQETLNLFGNFEPDPKEIKKLKKEAKQLASYHLFDLKNNALFSVAQVIIVCILAAICRSSLETKARKKNGLRPIADNIFVHFRDKLTTEKIEVMFCHFLDLKAAKVLLRKFPSLKLTIAIDFTDELFYGDKKSNGVIGHKPKNGTYYGFRFMTVCLVIKGVRYLLVAYPFYRGDDKIYLINKALMFLRSLGLNPRRVLVDREFQEVDVIALFNEQKIEVIVPAKKSKNYRRARKLINGLPGLVRGYQLTNEKGESIWTNLVILEDEDEHGKKVEHAYLTNIHENIFKDDAYLISEIYSLRWGIETAHRVHDQFKIRTCCKDPIVRYFFFIIAVLLYNLWIYMNLIMNDCNIGKEFRIKITVPEFCEQLYDFFRDCRYIVAPLRIAM